MNNLNKLPVIDYFCVWAKKPRSKPRKGHRNLGISDRYWFTGYIEVDQVRYRVQFSTYEDVYKLLGGVFTSKDTMVALYAAYEAGIAREQGDLFSPVIADTGGRIGEPVVIWRDQFAWMPYVIMTTDERGVAEIEVLGIETQMDTVIPIQTLSREPGGITMAKGRTRRWFWSRYRQGDAMVDPAVAA